MKIVEDSASRLILKESALTSYIIGSIFVLAGIGMGIAGFVTPLGWKLSAFGLIFSLIGLLVVIFSKSDIVIADKASRTLTITFKSLKNRAGQTQQAAFADVLNVQVSQQYTQQYVGNNGMNTGSGISFGSGGMNNGGYQTELQTALVVQLKNGSQITIASEERQAGMNLGITQSSVITGGQRLADAMGVPFQELGAPTLGEAVQSVRNIISGHGESFAQPQSPAALSPAPAPQQQPVQQPVAAGPQTPVVPPIDQNPAG